jgi:hypothetical protein
MAKSIRLLGQVITPETVREIVQKASVIQWGIHLLRWRYFDVHHEGGTYHRDALIPDGGWGSRTPTRAAATAQPAFSLVVVSR